jgi:hypothetical protein
MSALEIIDQLLRLNAAEREAVQRRLDEIDATAPLSLEEKRLIDARMAAYRQNPSDVQSWAVATAEIRGQLGL